MSIPDRPTDAPLGVDYFSGGARLTDGRLRAYLNSLEAQVDALVGGTVSMVVNDVNGDDSSSDGSASSPLKTIVEAERRISLFVDSEVVLTVRPHGGAGYAWPSFRARVFSGTGACIYVIFPEINIIATDTVVSAKNGTEWIITGGGLASGLWDGKTLEMTSGAAIGDRRTVRNNDDVNVVPVAEFSGTVVGGDSFRIIEPDPGNVILPDNLVPMVQGVGIANGVGPMEQPVPGTAPEYIPGVTIVNAIISVSPALIAVADARLSLIGCSIDAAVLYGRGQLSFGKHAWNAVRPPSTESGLSISSWVGWGVHFTSATVFYSASPYVSGYLVHEGDLTARSGIYDLNGHIKGALILQGDNAAVDRGTVEVSFGKAAPFTLTPQQNPGMIVADSDLAAACYASGDAYLRLYDETTLTNLGTAPIIRAKRSARVLCQLQIILAGTNGGDGIEVASGAVVLVTNLTDHASVELVGTVAGQLFSIGPRNIDATMLDDFNVEGDFVSGARAFWDAGLAVVTSAVTLATIGAVVAVEAVTATAAGPKLVQRSAAPAAGAVQVTYDAQGRATLTFNAADAVTVADVYVQPEDDGTMVRAI